MISWTNGNDTGFHDHDVSRGAVAVVEGEVVEERLVLGGPPRRLRHRAGETFDFDASHVHRMHQDSDAPAVSIHAYSPPLWRMGSYAVGAGRHAAPGVDLLRRGAAPGRGHGVAVEDCDLLVIGGGVMGLFTAYHASERRARVVVLERGRIGDPVTASYGRTRSFRNDYLDATYARLAHEAFRLWGEFERRTGTDVLVRCGCMNIAKRSVTPDLAAHLRAAELRDADAARACETESLDGDALRRRFPYLDADLAQLDVDAGVVDLPAVTGALARALGERGVRDARGRRDDARSRATAPRSA